MVPRPVPNPPRTNALWLTFIAAWRDDARERGSKAAQTYSKAHASLAACPVPFQHPAQTVQLDGIGPTIASRLEDELRKWCEENGEEMPEKPASAAAKPRKKRTAAMVSADAQSSSVAQGKARAIDDAGAGSDGDGDMQAEPGAPPPKRRGKTGGAPKNYVPAHRSGGYGILLGLYTRTSADTPEVYLTKSELVVLAQPHCDSAYLSASAASGSRGAGSSAAGPAGGYYTAWNSMKTLINKGYVYQTGNPPRFCLSHEGYEVARSMARIAGVVQGASNEHEQSPPAEQSLPRSPSPMYAARAARSAWSRTPSADDFALGPPADVNASATSRAPMQVDDSGARLPRRAKSALVLPSPTAARLARQRSHATSLSRAEREQERERDAVPISPDRTSRTRIQRISSAPSRSPPAAPAPPAGAPSASAPFHFAYLTDSNPPLRVRTRVRAALRLSDRDYTPTYAIIFPKRLREHIFVKSCVEKVGPVRESMIDEVEPKLRGWVRESAANEVAPGLGGGSGDFDSIITSRAPSQRIELDAGSNGHTPTYVDNNTDSDSDSDSIVLLDAPPPPSQVGKVASRSTRVLPFDPGDASARKSTSGNAPAAAAAPAPAPALARAARRGPRLSSIVPPPAAAGSWLNEIAPPPRSLSAAAGPSMSGGNDNTGLRRTVSEAQAGVDGDQASTSASTSIADTYVPPRFTPEIFPPGSFTIHLLLDAREVLSHGSTAGREYMLQALRARGVEADRRVLELGDAIWIARRSGGGGAQGDEVVLDFVVERKRLDDLTGSIRDGRWKEQKFRLSSSGISQILYLIEDYDVENQMKRFGAQIQTALSSTQVVDGFFVERTTGIDASVDYLARMHRVIRQLYEHTALHIIPDRQLSRPTYLRLQSHLRRTHPSTAYLTTFSAYQSLNSKSASTTLRDVWARMLLCFRGMSAEKTAQVVRMWETPRELWEAYERERERGEGEGVDVRVGEQGDTGTVSSSSKPKPKPKKDAAQAQAQPGTAARRLISDRIHPAEQHRRIGPALSEKIWEVFGRERYDS